MISSAHKCYKKSWLNNSYLICTAIFSAKTKDSRLSLVRLNFRNPCFLRGFPQFHNCVGLQWLSNLSIITYVTCMQLKTMVKAQKNVQSNFIVSENLQLDRLCAMQCNSHEFFFSSKRRSSRSGVLNHVTVCRLDSIQGLSFGFDTNLWTPWTQLNPWTAWPSWPSWSSRNL